MLIPQDVRDCIFRHARQEYPGECCGILLGENDATGTVIRLAIPAANAAAPETRHNRYLIEPRDILHADKKARELHLDIVGFYHSHPDHPAIPSATDLSLAWPDYVHLLASVSGQGALELRGWRLVKAGEPMREISLA